MSKMKKIILSVLIINIFVYGSDVFIDKKAGLMWQDNEDVKTIKKPWVVNVTDSNYKTKNYMDTSGDTAETYCKNLNLQGFTNWRLPTYSELLDLYLNKNNLKNILYEEIYWSSSTYESTLHVKKDSAWGVSFYDNEADYSFGYKDVSEYVRCVRYNKKITLPWQTPIVINDIILAEKNAQELKQKGFNPQHFRKLIIPYNNKKYYPSYVFGYLNDKDDKFCIVYYKLKPDTVFIGVAKYDLNHTSQELAWNKYDKKSAIKVLKKYNVSSDDGKRLVGYSSYRIKVPKHTKKYTKVKSVPHTKTSQAKPVKQTTYKVPVACFGCHGKHFEKRALGKSKIVKNMTAKEIGKALWMYRYKKNYGGSLKGVMQGQVAKYSKKELFHIAKGIKQLPN